ncbi:uncharacterized protein isoform X1 [Danio rerio]|uniref:Si:ch211-214j8.12 n=1 Tax=Danio rerio TaxID=7955 RepID=A2BGQ2_DANRE|nr:uncharacterized protein LOC100000539 [Danio rerio]XP_005171826.1 uncharacterized protein LOC100000539 isoform X1 [Danio rerio]XP_009299714.1 uncharacterized protein LOC100000539 isoform X1 [Danio rerio]|eukprot:NP_001091661.1 uncharacterized protein LOC100000539 [Danio rerio]
MPLFRQLEPTPERKSQRKKKHWTEDEEKPSTLIGLCLQSLAENMKELWAKDYAQKYMDQYFFRYIMGPFSLLPGELLEELLCILSSRNLLTRAALHLLLLPQLSSLSLASACSLVNASLCSLIQIRCQNLQSLDLSGSQNISASVLCELLGSQHRLRSLSLAGTLCDQKVMSVLSLQCPKLKHLDVSRCLHLTPAGLLPLAYREAHVNSTNTISSLLALDIGLAENEGDAVSAVAFLLLSLPGLQRLAVEGLGQACVLILNREFEGTEEFTSREGVQCLKDLWAKKTLDGRSSMSANGEERFTLEGKLDECLSLDESESRVNEWTGTSKECDEKVRSHIVSDNVTTCLKDVQGLSLDTLEAVGKVCPELRVLSLDCLQNIVNADSFEHGAVLARGLGRFSGQLNSLSLQFAGFLSDLVPALQAAGSNLLSLSLEGIKADGHTAFLELIRACPRLTSLSIHLDPPNSNMDEDDEDEDAEDEGRLSNLPCIPHLRSLTLHFSLDERQMKPPLCWTSLKDVLWALLRGASLLQKLSLIAVPCRLDPVFKLVLNHPAKPLDALDNPPLQCLRSASLNRSDITMDTVVHVVNTCRRLSCLDLSGCWEMSLSNITKLQSKTKRRRHTLQITWT